MDRSRYRLALILVTLVGVASSMPCSAAAQEIGVSSFGGGNGFYHFRFINGTRFEIGDTLRLRHVLYNVADSALSVRTRPCGFALDGTLQLMDAEGAGVCQPVEHRIAPGDSVWADFRGVISSPPGEYTLQVEYARLSRFDSIPRAAQTRSITVLPRDPRPRFSGFSRTPLMMATLPFVLHISGDSLFVNAREIQIIMNQAIRGFGMLPMRASDRAANEIARIWPYLIINLDVGPTPRYRLETSWVSRVPFPGDQAGQSAMPRTSCENWKEGSTASPAVFGATLVDELRAAVERYVSGQCGL